MSATEDEVDVLVFGAGPAGLSAAIAAEKRGLKVKLLEAGPIVEVRERYKASDIASGVGGAGLYSDGKFSYWPSASFLWNLENRDRLEAAYDWFRAATVGLIAPPEFPTTFFSPSDSTASVREKSYLSEPTTFDDRYQFIRRLEKQLAPSLATNCVVEELALEEGGVVATVATGAGSTNLRARAAVLAGGRFGMQRPEALKNAIPSIFRRYEFGVRIVSVAKEFVFKEHKSIDPKIILESSGMEFRTFCTIRNGEVSGTDFLGLVSYSGRADVAPTNFSNFGFNVRITEEPPLESQLAQAASRVLSGGVEPFQFGLPEYLTRDRDGFGLAIDGPLREGIRRLLIHIDETPDDLVIIGPCIEGVGRYPAVNSDLRVADLPVWVAGDNTGVFRGLSAAFVSGHYVGDRIADALENGG